MNLSTPVALILFNRPELVKAVFEQIAEAKPKVLLIIADGPRSPLDAQRCLEARSVIKRVNWDCEVVTNIADKNLGCRQRVVSGWKTIVCPISPSLDIVKHFLTITGMMNA